MVKNYKIKFVLTIEASISCYKKKNILKPFSIKKYEKFGKNLLC